MDLNIASFVAALISVTLTVVCSQQYKDICGLQKSYACSKTLRESIGVKSNPDDKDGELTEEEKDALRKTCKSAIDKYKSCMGPIINKANNNRKCPKLVVDMYADLAAGYKDGYNYICKEGFNNFLQYARCISKKETKAAVAPCNEKHWRKWQDLFVGAVTNEYSKAYIASETCKNVDMVKSCIVNKIKNSDCGEIAVKQQGNVIAKMTRPQVRKLECDPNKGTHKWATFWILLILGTAAFGAVHVLLVKMGMMAPLLPIPGLT